jgi:hypothetical protein
VTKISEATSIHLDPNTLLEHLEEFVKFYLVNLVFLPTFKNICQVKNKKREKKEFASNNLP